MGPLAMRALPSRSQFVQCICPLSIYIVFLLILCSTVFKKFAHKTAVMIDMAQSLVTAMLSFALLTIFTPLAMLLEFFVHLSGTTTCRKRHIARARTIRGRRFAPARRRHQMRHITDSICFPIYSPLHAVQKPLLQYMWALSQVALNKLMHILNGNISAKELRDVCNTLGLNHPTVSADIKSLLADSTKKNLAHDYFQQNMLFEIGKLITGSSTTTKGGKGAGKGKGKHQERCLWHELQPRPEGIFVDISNQPVATIAIKDVNNIAHGVFFAGVGEFERFLGITSRSPLAMITPPSNEIKRTLEQRKLSFKECTLACYDIKTHKTLPKAAIIVQLGEPVNISNSKSDASFEKPPETFEISVQIEVDQLEHHLRNEVSRQGSQAFNSILRAALPPPLVIQTYAIGWDPQTMYGLARVPLVHYHDVLKRSGPNGIYIKEKIRDGVKAQCIFALIHSSHLKCKTFNEALEQATALPHFGGVHRSNTGSKSIRFQADGIEHARRKLCKDDLFTDDNISVVTSQYHQVQGLPMGTSSAAVARGLKAWGWNVIPIKSWASSSSTIVWLVGSADQPPGEYMVCDGNPVTIVRDIQTLPATSSTKAEKLRNRGIDPLTLNDPWANVVKATFTASSPPPAPPAPAQAHAPKVQQVVEDRIQHMEKQVMDKVNGLVDDLRHSLTSDIKKINSQSSDTTTDESKILQHVDGLLSQLKQEQDISVKQIVLRQDAFEKNVEDNIKTLRDNHVSTQSQLAANCEQLNTMSTHLQELRQQQSSMEAKILQAISAQSSPPRKKGREGEGDDL